MNHYVKALFLVPQRFTIIMHLSRTTDVGVFSFLFRLLNKMLQFDFESWGVNRIFDILKVWHILDMGCAFCEQFPLWVLMSEVSY